MSGRHRAAGKASVGLIALLAGVIAVLVSVLAGGSAGAASTVDAQLTLSGVATPSSPAGGTTVGIHPGDSITFTPGTVPTTGPLVSLLTDVLGGITNVEVDITSGNLPGMTYPYKLGTCAGAHRNLTVPFPAKGSYSFKYTVSSVTVLPVLGCSLNQIQLTGSQLSRLTANNVSVSDTTVYTGKVVVADAPPAGGLSIQLPSQDVKVSAPVIGQKTVSVPGVAAPTVPVSIPTNVIPKPKPTTSSAPAGRPASKPAASGIGAYHAPPAVTIPDLVVPKGNGLPVSGLSGLGGGSTGLDVNSFGVSPGSVTGVGNSTPVQVGDAASPLGSASGSTDDAPLPPVAPEQIHLASNPEPTAQLPVLLAIIAILALATVTAAYAKMYLIKR